jgi:hypothetical protein
LKRTTEKVEKEYIEIICEEIMEFKRRGHYDESRLERKACDLKRWPCRL